MSDLTYARTLPAPSRAERNVASQKEDGHAKATSHFLAYAVLGRGAGIRMQAESMLELKHLYLLNADPDVVDLREQVRFRYGETRERQHVFDVVATMRDGSNIAYAVKPEGRLVSGRFLAEMEVVAWWVHATRFADDVRILTEADVDPVSLHNAKMFAAVREPDAEADAAAAAVAGSITGGVALRDLTECVGLGARPERALAPRPRRTPRAAASRAHHPDHAPRTGRRPLMERRIETAYPLFHIGQFDRVVIEGRAFRLVQQTADAHVLMPESGHGLAEVFSFERLNRLNTLGKVCHQPDGLLTASQPGPARGGVTATPMANLSPRQKRRAHNRYAMVAAFKELYAEEAVLMTEASIDAGMPMIRARAEAYLDQEADMAAVDREARARAGQGRRRMGGGRRETVDPVHPRTLLGWVRLERAQGKGGLVDGFAKRGNRMSRFRPEENELLMATVRSSYLTSNRSTKKNVHDDVCGAFLKVNAARAAAGLAELRTPSRAAVRAAIDKLDAFHVVASREGLDAAVKRFRPVGQGVEVSRPLEHVEIDEWRIDLMSIMASAGLRPLFTPEECEALGLNDSKARWWVAVAIDRRTRIILGMVLTKDPRASAALSCLRMVVSHKGAFSDATGAACVWEQFGAPELLVYDNGPGFRANVFTDACNDLGITAAPAPAGVPEVRAVIERVFGTCATNLLPRLSGRTFSDVVDRGDHPSEKRACLSPEDLCFALVRWIVDIYHNTPHAGLGGRTPRKQWELDHRDGLLPLRAAPDREAKRLAFGVRLERKADKSGVVVMGVRYHSHELAAHLMRQGARMLKVRWDPEDIGAVDICVGENWIAAPAVHPGFEGLNAQVWLATRRALRAESPRERSFREETVLRAIEAITALNAQRSLAFGLIDKPFDAKRLEELERGMFSSFAISSDPTLSQPRDGGRGRSVTPRLEVGGVLPEDAEEDAPAPRKRGDDAPWTLDE